MIEGLLSRLCTTYDFSLPALRRLAEVLSIRELIMYLEEARSPGSLYYLRVNTLRASRECVIKLLREEGFNAFPSRLLKEAIYLEVRGPFVIRPQGKPVFVDKATAESAYMGAHVYAPGVKKAPRVHEGDTVTVYDPRGNAVAIGIAEMDGEEMETTKRGLAVRNIASVFRVPSVRETRAFKEGLVYDQSLPAMLATAALAPKPGWFVIDLCAAPGGKATHAAQLMLDEGVILAVDRNPAKVSRLQENASRLGIRCIKTFVKDSRYLDTELGIEEEADAVIVDPPCSALGVRPKLYYDKTQSDLIAYPPYQRQFLRVAARLVKPGGLVLYSTCTVTLEENEFLILSARKYGLYPITHRPFYGTTSPLLGPLGQRFYPHIHDTPGFFIAVLRKAS